jgi:hypothetical protein
MGMLRSAHRSHPTLRLVMTGGGDFMGSHLLARLAGLGMSVR